MSRNRKVVVAVIVALIIVGSVWLYMRQPETPLIVETPTTTPIPTPTQTPEETPSSTETVEEAPTQEPLRTPPTPEEKASIMDAVMTYYDARKQHDYAAIANCYCEDGEWLTSYYHAVGRSELQLCWTSFPWDTTAWDLEIHKIEVNGDKAFVTTTYYFQATKRSPNWEKLELVKVDGEWLIAFSENRYLYGTTIPD